MTEGKKLDSGKPDLSLLPRVALEQMAYAFMWGESKYARYQYCSGFDSHRLIAAAMRHLQQWQDGEDNDPENLIAPTSHLGHALASIAMLLHTIQLGTNRDTRYKKGPHDGK